MNENEIINRLGSINWNFDYKINYSDDLLPPFNCRKYHSYPATFIPEIPYTLIEILSNEGDKILDPFGGIGTTFFQALLLGRRAYTYDINVVANMINRNLFILLNPSFDICDAASELSKKCDQYIECNDYTQNVSKNRKELFDWYSKNTFNQLAFLFSEYEQINNNFNKSLFEICLSNILTTTSSQNRGWAYIADNVKPKEKDLKDKDAISRFKYVLNLLSSDIKKLYSLLPSYFADFYNFLSKNDIIF